MNTMYVRTSSTAVVSLVFGIACWVIIPFLGAIVAVVTGHIARGEIRRAPPGTLEGDGMALAGLILGWIHLACWLIALIVIFLFFGGLALFAHFAH